jgi:hypothetical protein
MLQWLRARGCPWSPDTVDAATAAGFHDVAAWARDAQCPGGSKKAVSAAKALAGRRAARRTL